MAKFITLGCYTAKGLAGFVNNPATDRKAATSALAASAGAKITRYAGLRGKYDFMAEIEGTFEQAAAAAMVAVSSGAVSDFTILEDVNLNENPYFKTCYIFYFLLKKLLSHLLY